MATYGSTEWSTETENTASFSRAVSADASGGSIGRLTFNTDIDLPALDHPRFFVAYHLLSLDHNVRLRVRVFAPNDEIPVVPSVTSVWACSDWYEREAFDLYGILFDGHNDLRRILTDYGFTGHPFRKDFPLIGNVEMRYDPLKERVVYEPVTIEPRVLVPKVIREDSRYLHGDDSVEASDA
jgi:NADH-quinone oxidoreductase subunit C